MGKHTSIIEINGKRYDAITGTLILPSQKTAQPKTMAKLPTPSGVQPAAQAPTKPSTVLKKSVSRQVNPAAHKVHQRTKRSQTLMRSVVKKPVIKHTPKTPTHSQPKARPDNVVAHKPRHVLDLARLKRATSVATHNQVKRFGLTNSSFSNDAISSHRQVVAAASTNAALASRTTSVPMPSMITSVSHHGQLPHLLKQGLDRAQSHTQKPKNPKPGLRRRIRNMPNWASIGSASLAAIFLVGFFAYQNMPNFAMRIAAQRSGVTAQMPGYTPQGFRFSGPIIYSSDEVVVRFSATADSNRNFLLAQRSSNWNNETLLSEFVSENGRQYQTLQDKGKTVYIYDSNATWLDQGTWYTIESNADLSSDQILKIVGSI